MNTDNEPRIGSREQWLAARLRLLAEEKELTRRSDELARQRQQLPWGVDFFTGKKMESGCGVARSS